MKEIVIGSRGSKLALWQARYIASRLEAVGRKARIEIIGRHQHVFSGELSPVQTQLCL